MYEERFYRKYGVGEELLSFEVKYYESDLLILAEKDLRTEAMEAIKEARKTIEDYALERMDFLTSLEPLTEKGDEPLLIKQMLEASSLAGVGPMAAVAGAINYAVAERLMPETGELIIENGGDVLICSAKKKKVLIYAGSSPFSEKIAVEIESKGRPLGICTSSGTFGHSLSFGKADAVVVISENPLLADAAATAIANRIKNVEDFPGALELAQGIVGVKGLLLIKADKLAAWGELQISPVARTQKEEKI